MRFFLILLSLFFIVVVFVDHSFGQNNCQKKDLSVGARTNGKNDKYVIEFETGDCIYTQGRIIGGDNIRLMTVEEKATVQKYLDGKLDLQNLPYFCSC
uniref:Uncharacterized protein n=1 Tax=Panagrolaimus davidi TaxID=227884 RepID=A0A914QWD3_9BILA